jgi:hypothetical protein
MVFGGNLVRHWSRVLPLHEPGPGRDGCFLLHDRGGLRVAGESRVVNGGGFVDREYGIGTGRTGILVRKPWTGPDGKPALQMEAIELKIRTTKTGDPLPQALTQLDGYLSRCGLEDGYLPILDRRPAVVRQEIQPRFSRETTASGRAVTVLLA